MRGTSGGVALHASTRQRHVPGRSRDTDILARDDRSVAAGYRRIVSG